MGVVRRLFTYTVVGFAAEVAVSGVHDVWRKKPVRFRTSPWMLPVYSLLLPLYEPVHDALRSRSWANMGREIAALVEGRSGA